MLLTTPSDLQCFQLVIVGSYKTSLHFWVSQIFLILQKRVKSAKLCKLCLLNLIKAFCWRYSIATTGIPRFTDLNAVVKLFIKDLIIYQKSLWVYKFKHYFSFTHYSDIHYFYQNVPYMQAFPWETGNHPHLRPCPPTDV